MNDNINDAIQDAETTSSVNSVVGSDVSDEDFNGILEDNGIDMSFSENASTATVEERPSQVTDNSDNQEEVPEELEDFLESDIDENAQNEEESSAEEPDSITVSENNKLPCNSPTFLIDESTIRFSGAEWFNEIQKARIIIAGVGGIGSNVAFQIARMAPNNITLYDDDKVELANMAGQLYSIFDVGKNKVDAISRMLSDYTTAKQIRAVPSKFSMSTEPGDIMICGFDNMRARTIFFSSWKGHIKGKTEEERKKCLYMDGRLSMDTLQILCITGDDDYNISRYEKEFLFADSMADATICSMKQTTYLACMIGSLMTNLFTNFIADTLEPEIPYDLPFFTEYDAQNMIFKTEN